MISREPVRNNEYVVAAPGKMVGARHSRNGEEAEMYIGVGTVVGIILLVLLLMWIF